jgi:hypothetical protein
MSIDTDPKIIPFGKYKGRLVEEVLTGWTFERMTVDAIITISWAHIALPRRASPMVRDQFRWRPPPKVRSPELATPATA